MLEFIQGDMFEAAADVRVNTVNCVGVMGAGVALAFKQRYPEMFKDYQRDCKDGRVVPGRMHVWKSLSGDWVVNFPTKRDWRDPSRYEDIEAGLDDLRGYLDTVGPVSVALPALGCGHGGLDWSRVSSMIRDKLEGVDAHVLVFAPAASRQAGRSASEVPTDDERKAAVKLGYEFLESQNAPGLDAAARVYLAGDREALARKWIALLPGRVPVEREMQALTAIAGQLARSGNRAAVALVHSGRVSEEIAQIFVDQGVKAVLLLPFGVLTRKSVAKGATTGTIRGLVLVSAAPANARWSRQLFAQAMEMLRGNAGAVLSSDPEPDWLTGKGLAKWSQAPISYVRYEATPPDMREALAEAGAKPIGRRAEDGAPNIDYLISRWASSTADHDDAVPPKDDASEPQTVSESSPDIAAETVFAAKLGTLSDVSKRELFDMLMQLDTNRLDITISLLEVTNESDVLRLNQHGFTQQNRSDRQTS